MFYKRHKAHTARKVVWFQNPFSHLVYYLLAFTKEKEKEKRERREEKRKERRERKGRKGKGQRKKENRKEKKEERGKHFALLLRQDKPTLYPLR